MAVRLAELEHHLAVLGPEGHAIPDKSGKPISSMPGADRLHALLQALTNDASRFAGSHPAHIADIAQHAQALYRHAKQESRKDYAAAHFARLQAAQAIRRAADPRLLKILDISLGRSIYCCNEFQQNKKRNKLTAITFKNIQLNTKDQLSFLIVDADRTDAATAWADANLPAPTWIAQSPSGRAHLVWALSAQDRVYRGGDNQAPARYAKAIERAYSLQIRGDQAYPGLLTKNPLNPAWRVTSPSNFATYDLSYLAEFADLKATKEAKPSQTTRKTAKAILAGFQGRNALLFDEVRLEAYKAVRDCASSLELLAKVTAIVSGMNSTLDRPLNEAEANTIARSITTWTWRNRKQFTASESLAARQAASRAKALQATADRVAADKKKAQKLRAQGLTRQAIADRMQVSLSTVKNWLNGSSYSRKKAKQEELSNPLNSNDFSDCDGVKSIIRVDTTVPALDGSSSSSTVPSSAPSNHSSVDLTKLDPVSPAFARALGFLPPSPGG